MRLLYFLGLFLVCVAKLDFESEKVHKDFDESSKIKISNQPSQHLVDDFKRTFISKRKDHQIAVSNFFTIDEGKRAQFIQDVVRNVQTLLESSREVLHRVGHKADDPFPQDGELIQAALSKVLENMALFAEINTNFSMVISKLFHRDNKLRNVIEWGYYYSVQTKLMDPKTDELMNNMASLLNILKNEESADNSATAGNKVSKSEKMDKEKASSIKKNKIDVPKTEL